MLFPELAELTDIALLLLRLLIGLLFAKSGWSHLQKPEERGESIGFSPGFTRVLGFAEFAAGIGIAVGLLPQISAFVIMGVMFGAIYKKLFAWKTGFWGEDNGGWFYDVLYLVCAFVIATTGGGSLVIWP
ncbi:MAG: DoxX family protein [Gemmatimonadota bacterium]